MGSHHIFVHRDVSEVLNIQNVRGEIEPYKVREFPRIVERHNLRLEQGK